MPVVLGGLLLVTSGAAEVGTRDRLECLGRVRRDLGVCMQRARERCQAEFETRLPGCFPGSPCPSRCLETQEACVLEPMTDRDGCRLACQADQKVRLKGCKLAKVPEECRRTVRTKGSKCKTHCTRRAAPVLQACKADFSECVRGCASE